MLGKCGDDTTSRAVFFRLVPFPCYSAWNFLASAGSEEEQFTVLKSHDESRLCPLTDILPIANQIITNGKYIGTVHTISGVWGSSGRKSVLYSCLSALLLWNLASETTVKLSNSLYTEQDANKLIRFWIVLQDIL